MDSGEEGDPAVPAVDYEVGIVLLGMRESHLFDARPDSHWLSEVEWRILYGGDFAGGDEVFVG